MIYKRGFIVNDHYGWPDGTPNTDEIADQSKTVTVTKPDLVANGLIIGEDDAGGNPRRPLYQVQSKQDENNSKKA